MPTNESMLDDSLLCSLSWKSYSDSTPLCSDSDCTFEHCKAAKRSNDEKQRLTHRADDSTQYDAPSKHLNFYTLRDDIRNRETVPRSFKFIPSVPHRNPAFFRVPPGFEWKDVHFSKCVQQIPPDINRETRLGLNDVQLFANVMRAGRRNIDSTYLDVGIDPVVSQFLWNTIGTPLLENYPDLLYLRQQLGRRIKEHIEKHSHDNVNLAAHRNTNKITINDLPHINQILIDSTKIRPKPIDKENDFGIDRTSMYKCRRSDPYMATIQTAIYSEPQALPINFHKAAEDFALLSYPTTAEPLAENIIKNHGNLSESRNPVNNGFSFKPNAVSFKPSLSSTPIKNYSLPSDNNFMSTESLMSNFTGYPQAIYQPVPGPSSHMFVPWYSQSNSVFLYPQTLLMSSPKAPRVYPDMTSE